MEPSHHYLVPEQYKGIKKDLSYAVNSNDTDEALSWFIEMKDRLLDVNNWEREATAAIIFELADKHKKTLHRNAHAHDLVQIQPNRYQIGDIWTYAQVDIIEYDYDPDTDQESIGMRICLPYADDEGIAYNIEHGTITLVCDRDRTHLSASMHLRNDDGEPTAWTNAGDEQWQRLLKSFVDG